MTLVSRPLEDELRELREKEQARLARQAQCQYRPPPVPPPVTPSPYSPRPVNNTLWSNFWAAIWDWSLMFRICLVNFAIMLILFIFKTFSLFFCISFLDAAMYGDLTSLKRYLNGEKGTKIHDINEVNLENFSALHLAAEMGHVDIVKYLTG